MRTSVHGLCFVWVVASCGPRSTRAPDASVAAGTLELLSGQAPRVEVAGAVPSEQAARLLQAVEEVDRRYNYYGGAGLATRHQVGMVGPHQTVALAIPGRAGRCHRIAFASEIPGISVSLQHLAFRQGPVIGSTGALGQYRQICPTSSVVYRLEVTTNAPAPIAFAVHQTEFAR